MGDAGTDGWPALSQSTVIVAALLGGFVLYLAVNQRIGTYLSIVGL